jgi:hypothetical protein
MIASYFMPTLQKSVMGEVLVKNVKLVDPISDGRWDSFVINHPEGTIFHHSAWARVLMSRYHHGPRYYVLEDENGEIRAAAPFYRVSSPITGKRLVCLPSSEYCYPLGDNFEDIERLVQAAVQDVNEDGDAYLEIRGWPNGGTPEASCLMGHPCFLTHVVELDRDPQKVRAHMDRNGRYNLRHAEKAPITVHLGQDEKDLKKLYHLTEMTRRRIQLLPLCYSLLRSVYQHVIVPGYGYILLAEIGGKIAAANMYFCFKDTVLHEVNAADAAYFEYRPNYLLVWTAMARACEESYRYYHFGTTHPDNANLASFKRHWGSQEKGLPYYYYPEVAGIKSLGQGSLPYRFCHMVNRYLPSLVTRSAARLLYSHMG